MIAALAMYTLLVGLLLGFLAVLAERGVRLVGGPTRLVWAVAMSAMVVFPAAAMLMREQPIVPAPTVLRGGDVAAPGGLVSMSSIGDDNALVVSTARERLTNTWRELLNRVHDGAAGYDGVLLALWAVVSAFLLGMMLHALSEARRMRLGLKSENVCGTTVLVSEEIGPAAMGGNPRAIVIPRWVMDLDDSLRSLVIRHEQEHLATRDPAMLTAALCTLVLMPWHPVLWWSWRRLRLAIECDCDARVLRREPSPKTYGQLLLLVSHHRSTAPRGQRLLMSLAAPLSPQASQLKQRIDAMTTRPTRHRRSTIAALTAGVLGASLLIAAVPAPSSNQVYMAGSPLEYRWVAREAVGAGISVLPRRTEGGEAAVSVSEPFLTLADVDSIMVTGADNGEAMVGAMVSAAARDRLRATTRQRIGSEIAVVVDGAVITVATVNSELGGPLPIWTGAAAEASAVAARLRVARQQSRELREGASVLSGS
jgi:beta-lactamase regulating signal transducer with metallopeptidase domain